MPSYNNENSNSSTTSTCHQPIDTIQDKIDLIDLQYDLIYDLTKDRKRFKAYWIISLVFLFVTSAIAMFEFNTIRYMASDLRDQRSINADLEQLLGGCMQSQFTLTGDSK